MEVDIFDNRLLYCGLDEFIEKRVYIKTLFRMKSSREQFMYKLYVYSRPFISETWKNYQWDYLQGDITELELMNNYTSSRQTQKRNTNRS